MIALDPSLILVLQVILKRYHREKDLPLLDKTRFAVDEKCTLGEFTHCIR